MAVKFIKLVSYVWVLFAFNLLYESCTYNFTVLFSLLQKDENMMPGFWQTLAC